MALTYEQQGMYAGDNLLLSRTTQASVEVALAVMAEDGGTAGHEQRATYAAQVLRNPPAYAPIHVRGVLTNPNCGTEVDDPLDDDSALEFVLTSMWNAYAGYSPVA